MAEPGQGPARRSARPSRQPAGLVGRLAVADYRQEWVMSGCSILALAAVLIPLLVLFGLKYGIITNLLDPLIENPRYREITPMASGRFEPAWFEGMRARGDVEFIVPRTRTIAASLRLRAPGRDVGRILDVELIPSAEHDPLLDAQRPPPSGYQQVVLSATTAEKIGVQPQDRVEGILTRTRRDTAETVRLPLEVTAVASATAFARDGMFVSVELMTAVEDFLDGRAVPALGWDGAPARGDERAFAGFRLYARDIEDVAAIRRVLADENIDVRTSVADISLVQTLDRNLGVAYWIIALIAISGYVASFAASVWANVDRKRREFSVLRLIGFGTGQITLFPILQAALTATLAWALACLVFLVVQAILNALFATTIGGGQPVCRLQAWHLLAALVVTLMAAVFAAALGGRRVSQLEPSIGLRDG